MTDGDVAQQLERERQGRADAEAATQRVVRELTRTMEELHHAKARLETADTMRESFLQVVAREVRLPLASVLSIASGMSTNWESIPDKNKRGYLRMIVQQVRQLSRLAEDVNAYHSVSHGALALELETLGLAAILDDVLTDFDEHAGDITLEVDRELVVHADRAQVTRILRQFISNALKHGAPPVRIEAMRRDPWVEVRVTDEGPGLPADVETNVFDAAGDLAAANPTRGIGLGLSVARDLALLQRAEVWFERNEPTGSMFGLRLRRP